MPTQSERNALLFLASVALVGAGVRSATATQFVRQLTTSSGGARSAVVSGASPDLGAAALQLQIAAVDSARAARDVKAPKPRSTSRGTFRSAPRSAPAKTRKPEAESSSGDQVPTIMNRKSRTQEPVSVNVNRATNAELEQLPRVGPALAARIIQWRELHGPFRSVEDLRHVRGIGPTTAALLAPSVTF